MKGILFAGDSYTWGEGLHHYSDLHFDYENPSFDVSYEGYDRDYITPAQIQFIKSKRFARQVANYFNTFELVRKNNGGMNYEMFQFIDEVNNAYHYEYVDVSPEQKNQRQFQFILQDFDYIIVQLTDMFREGMYFDDDGKLKNYNIKTDDSVRQEEFYQYLINKFGGNFNGYVDRFLLDYALFIEKKFMEYESKGIKKCYLITWHNDIIPFVENLPFLKERFITFDVEGKNYKSIMELQSREDRPKNMLLADDSYFLEKNIFVNNGHTSLKAHTIIAQSIINKINYNEQASLHTV